jgi:predicted  nucleic acid-binding Zn-ribbon protein
MKIILENLLKLQSLQLAENQKRAARTKIKDLRAQIPEAMLLHHDRLAAREKQGLVEVRNQCCSGCHMHVPIGTLLALVAGENVVACDSCGRYLYLSPSASEEILHPAVTIIPAKPRRKAAKSLALSA